MGGLRLTVDGRAVHLPARSGRLLALLALRGPTSRALAAGYLWPDVPEPRARGSTRAAVRDVQARAPTLLQVTSSELTLNGHVVVDVRDLRALAGRLLHPDVDDETLRRGDDLAPGGRLGGDLLPGYQDDWALAESQRLHQLRLHALDALVDHLVDRRRFGEALEVALATISTDPLRESTHRGVMRIYLAEGNPVEALRQYERFRTTVNDAMGIEPSHQMTRLVEEITQGTDRQPPLPATRRNP